MSAFTISAHIPKEMKRPGRKKDDDHDEDKKQYETELRIKDLHIANNDIVDHTARVDIRVEDQEAHCVYEDAFDHRVQAGKKWKVPHISINLTALQPTHYIIKAKVRDESGITWDKEEAILMSPKK